MSNIDYQVVINMVCTFMSLAFPIALIFMVVQKITGIFISFVFGKEITF